MLLAAEGLFQMLGLKGYDGARAINLQLRMLGSGSGADPEDVLRVHRRKQEPEELERLYLLKHWPALPRKAGFGGSPSVGPAILIGWAALVFLMLHLETSPLIAAGAALLVGLLTPAQALRMLRDYRVKRLSRQMPDTIDLMVRSLRAGHPLNAAFQVIARGMPDRVNSEFGAVAITYGDDLPVALAATVRLVTPIYYGNVWNDPIFMPLAGTGVALMVMNALVLRRMVRFHF